ncbi:methyltransferase family protein [Parasphingorhabdus sp.]|uniref:methyltransferase family protein n=1 Tax=Parasphingorhabdus sp. TaxID=2709688 RepID=UPI003D2AC06D
MKLRIPPVVQTILFGTLSWLTAKNFPVADISYPVLKYLAIGLFLFGTAILLQAVLTFARQNTTVNPLEPEKADKLVLSGLYRYTRNPMYLGLAAILFALAFVLQNVAALAGPILFLITMTVLQIKPEERALSEKFGQQYIEYRQRVRRWL